jgi:plasmid stability protein
MTNAHSAEVLRVLAARHYRCSCEAELQELVQTALSDAGLSFQREKRLSVRDRVDFLIEGGVALELKVKVTEKNLLSQILRYAESAEVDAIVVAGTCHSVLRLPARAHGKPVHALHLKSW